MNFILLRAISILSAGFYFLAGILLLGFGLFDLMVVVFLISMAATWLIWTPLLIKNAAAIEFAEQNLFAKYNADGKAGKGLTLRKYTRLRSVFLRRRIRRDAELSQFVRHALDYWVPALNTVAWLACLYLMTLLLTVPVG